MFDTPLSVEGSTTDQHSADQSALIERIAELERIKSAAAAA
jgi:hypothetical protein